MKLENIKSPSFPYLERASTRLRHQTVVYNSSRNELRS